MGLDSGIASGKSLGPSVCLYDPKRLPPFYFRPMSGGRPRALLGAHLCQALIYCGVGVPCRHWLPAIFAAAITAWVRLSTPSFCSIADTCALIVASDTPSS